jgi:four helix bundle protein
VSRETLGEPAKQNNTCARARPRQGRFAPASPVRASARSLDSASDATRGSDRAAESAEGQNIMLRIYPIVFDWLEELAPLISRIARYDADLAKQLRRSSTSVVLNMAEGMMARGGHRTNAYGTSLREMRESYAALEVAQRFGYVKPLSTEFQGRCRQILGTLVRLVFPRRG